MRLPVVALALLLGCSNPESGFRNYSVVLIVIDSLRARDLGCYGSARDTSSFLDSLAREGVVFSRASSTSSYTRESVTSLLTGKLPSSGGGTGWNAMPHEASDHLAERFQASGYRTGFVSNSLMIRGSGFQRGFDVAEFPGRNQFASGGGETLSDTALDFVRKAPDEKFFLYLHYLDPHGPYHPDAAYVAKLDGSLHPRPLKLYGEVREHCSELRKQGFAPGEEQFDDLKLRYDAEIASTSEAIRRLLDGLESMGALDRTLVIVTSDHGEEFLEHGYVEHAWTLYEESIHVPLILWAPGRLAPQRVDAGVSLVDLMPTLLALFEWPADDSDGRPLFEYTDDSWTAISSQAPRFAELQIQTRNLLRSVTLGDWKYIAAQRWLSDAMREQAVREKRAGDLPAENFTPIDPWAPVTREELYDLAADPGESRNLAGQEVAQLERMRALMQTHRARAKNAPAATARGLEFSDEELLELEALGYH
jgi:arylsulfatase A-like enzyme